MIVLVFDYGAQACYWNFVHIGGEGRGACYAEEPALQAMLHDYSNWRLLSWPENE